MIPEPIRVFLATRSPDAPQQRALERLLEQQPGFHVVGGPPDTPGGPDSARARAAAHVAAAVRQARPDIVLVDLDSTAVDGLGVTETIAGQSPWVSILALAARTDTTFLGRVGAAGAHRLLVRPFTDAALVTAIEQLYYLDAGRRAAAAAASAAGAAGAGRPPHQGEIFAFFAAKGGMGCTTLACNAAIALKQATGRQVALFDCNLLFGDAGLLLNLASRRTIADVPPLLGPAPGPPAPAGPAAGAAAAGPLDDAVLGQVMVAHASGVKVLLAPPTPQQAWPVTAAHVAAVLRALRARFDYVVVDTAPTLEEHVLHVLDAADRIVLPMTLELTAVKNARLLLDLLGALGCPPERLVLVLNRAGSRAGVSAKEAEQVLGRRFAAEVASDWRLATLAGEKGIPLVTADPEALVSRHIAALARTLAGIGAPATGEARPRWTGGLLRTMLGTGKRPSAAPAGVPDPATGPRGRGAPAPPPGRGAGPARSAPAGARVGLRPAAAPS